MEITRVKLTANHFSTGLIKPGSPIRHSIELKKDGSENILIKKMEYIEEGLKVKAKVKEMVCVDAEVIFSKIRKLKLEDCKNNYFDDKSRERYQSWVLEYDQFGKQFKIIGTYNNLIEEFQIIAKLLNFSDFP